VNDKPTFKFQLTVNDSSSDGFKLSVQATTDKQIDIAKELTEKLIEKIKSIEYKYMNYDEK